MYRPDDARSYFVSSGGGQKSSDSLVHMCIAPPVRGDPCTQPLIDELLSNEIIAAISQITFPVNEKISFIEHFSQVSFTTYLNTSRPQLSTGFTAENPGNATISNFFSGKSTPQ